MDFSNFTPYVVWFVSIVFIVVALYVIFFKKPLIINSIWIVIMLFLCFVAPIFSSITYFIVSQSIISIIPIISFAVLTIMFLYVMNGYSVYGVNDTDFQEKLINVLTEKNYDFMQELSSIKIINQDMETTIAIQSGLGVSHLRLKGKGDRTILKSIVQELRNKKYKLNYLFPIFYLIIGALICTLSVYLILNN